MKQSMMQLAVISTVIAVGISFANPVSAKLQRYTQINIFGDSLSDPGNTYKLTGGLVPPNPPYFDGRFSNGPVWAEAFDKILGLAPKNYADLGSPIRLPREGVNFAFAGATSGSINLLGSSLFGLQQQIHAFTQLKLAKQGPVLYALWIGGNDYLSDPFQSARKLGKMKPLSPQFVPKKTPTETVNNIVNALKTLAQSGAKTILVFNLPDLGATPFGRSIAPTQLTQLSQDHNAALKSTLSKLSRQYPKTKFISVDIYRLFNLVSTKPQLFKLKNVTQSCLNTNALPPTICNKPNTYLFWDGVHPTKVGHEIIAKFALASLFWQGQSQPTSNEFSVNEILPALSANY